MSAEQIVALTLSILDTIAPEADLTHLDPDVSYRDQFDFDSIDCLHGVCATRVVTVGIP
jgi:hypothetical protein